MKYDVNILNDYIAKGLLEVQSHPILPLKIYNYSRECAWEKKWDEITSSARGLILDVEGNVIAKGFNKFLNYEEYSYEQIPWNDEVLYIQDKADGSLGIIFHYAGGWHIATRGSFTSDQALKAMEILKKNHPTYNDDLHPELTYLVEIIYPENRIVLDYAGEEKLILLSINHVDQELDWEKVVELNDEFFELISTTKVTNFDSLLINELKRENISNKEGYVYRFFPSNFRMKGKFEEYVRLHALMTKFSNVDIWKCLSTNTPIDLENVPDEFDAWVKKTIKELKFNHYRLGDQVYKVFRYHEYGKYNDEEPSPTKKAFAEWVKIRPKWEHAILFRMYEGREFDSILWKLLRPKYQKPFWQKEVEV